MRALLLAAGLGSRLKPLTEHIPKCLAPINGRPLIDYWLDSLQTAGITKVLINTHYMAPMVTEYIQSSTWKKFVTVVFEKKLLGTGGTILKNKHFFGENAFLVAHADNLSRFDIKDFQREHRNRPKNTEFTMMTFASECPELCGVVEIDGDKIVQNFHEKTKNPPGNLSNAAVYLFEPMIIDFISTLIKDHVDLSLDVVPKFLGRIFTYHNTLYHRDIGSLESWRTANADFPIFIAKEQNAAAWQSLIKQDNCKLEKNIRKLIKK